MGGKIDLNLGLRVCLYGSEEVGEEGVRNDYGKDAIVQFVLLMDVGKEAGDDDPEAIASDSPCGMLSARAATEVAASDEDAGAGVGGIVEHEGGDGLALLVVAPIVKEIVAEALFRGGFEKAGGDDLIRVDVLERKGDAGAAEDGEFFVDNRLTMVVNK